MPPERHRRNLRALLGNLGGALALVWTAARSWTLASGAITIGLGLLPLLSLLLLKGLIDSVVATATSPAPAWTTPALYVSGMAAVGLLIAALQAASTLVSEIQSQRLTDHVQGLIHEKSIALDLEFFDDPAYFDQLHRAQREGASRPSRLVSRITGLLTQGLSLLAVAGLLVALNPLLVFVGLALGLPAFVMRMRRSDERFEWGQRRTSAERLLNVFDATLTKAPFAKELRLYRLGELYRQRHRDLRDEVREERFQLAWTRARSELIGGSIGALLLAAVLIYVTTRVGPGGVTVGAMVMYLRAAQQALGHQQQLFGSIAGIYEDGLFLENLAAFLSLEPRIRDSPSSRRLPAGAPARSIVFDRVSFRYPGTDRDVLDNFQLELRAGEVTAVVGANGSGKSTLVKLLCRLYDPDRGRILVDGEDLRSFNLSDLRARVSILFQDFAQFPTTVAENIAFGEVDRLGERAAVEQASRWAALDDKVAELPAGYDTLLGRWFDSGQELSQGQWQRLSLARARFRDAPIIVLDEPSSSLDALAEEHLLDRLMELAGGKTTLIISHRFSSVRAAHHIGVMEEGRLVEWGTHEQLVERAGAYARMYTAQARRYA